MWKTVIFTSVAIVAAIGAGATLYYFLKKRENEESTEDRFVDVSHPFYNES